MQGLAPFASRTKVRRHTRRARGRRWPDAPVVGLPALVPLEEGDLHHFLEEAALLLPQFKRSELGELLLAAAHAVRHTSGGDRVMIVGVRLRERHDLQVVRVPSNPRAVCDVHVRKLVIGQLCAKHLDEPERVAAVLFVFHVHGIGVVSV
eukprot:1253870-Pleurochrysis_carterae.AAC.2